MRGHITPNWFAHGHGAALGENSGGVDKAQCSAPDNAPGPQEPQKQRLRRPPSRVGDVGWSVGLTEKQVAPALPTHTPATCRASCSQRSGLCTAGPRRVHGRREQAHHPARRGAPRTRRRARRPARRTPPGTPSASTTGEPRARCSRRRQSRRRLSACRSCRGWVMPWMDHAEDLHAEDGAGLI